MGSVGIDMFCSLLMEGRNNLCARGTAPSRGPGVIGPWIRQFDTLALRDLAGRNLGFSRLTSPQLWPTSPKLKFRKLGLMAFN